MLKTKVSNPFIKNSFTQPTTDLGYVSIPHATSSKFSPKCIDGKGWIF